MNRRISAGTRRLVLGTALAAAMAAWLFPHSTLVRAAAIQEQVQLAQAADPKAADARPEPRQPRRRPATPRRPPSPLRRSRRQGCRCRGGWCQVCRRHRRRRRRGQGTGTGTDIRIDRHGIRVEKGRKHVTVEGLGTDREYDSFESFVQDAPWLAGLVFMVVLLVFLMPLLIIALLIWYKVRKNRMLNETMLKLAERGVVPPAEAMAAIARCQSRRRPGPRRPRCTSRRSSSGSVRRGPTCARACPDRRRPRPSRSIRCSTTARRTGSASSCCSLGIGYCRALVLRGPQRAARPPARAVRRRQVDA